MYNNFGYLSLISRQLQYLIRILFCVNYWFYIFLYCVLVKLLDWGEEGHRTEAEIQSLRAAFTQEVAVWHKLDHPNVTKVTF